jgi:hypothetical protein
MFGTHDIEQFAGQGHAHCTDTQNFASRNNWDLIRSSSRANLLTTRQIWFTMHADAHSWAPWEGKQGHF